MPFFFCFSFSVAHAQWHCAAEEKTRNRVENSPVYAQQMEALDSLSAQYELGLVLETARATKQVDLAVVVHIVYQDEYYNISNEQVHSQIEALNRDFNWEQSDKYKIPEVWRDLGKETGFRFHLADKDPDGNFTNGITRTQTKYKDIGDTERYYSTAKGGMDPWPQPHYINIWVCEIGDNVLGYSYLPSNSVEPSDGIVIDPRAFGTTGTVALNYNLGRTLVHELGHYFGLRHPWGNEEGTCTNTDYMKDTPWQREANFGCPNFPSISCPSESYGDMFMNFMDYSNDSCSLLFTKNQVGFMRLVLQTSKITLLHSPAFTGMDKAETKRFSVWPNPSSGTFYVNFPAQTDALQYQILDISGRTVKSGVASGSGCQIDLSALRSGLYVFVSELGSESLVLNRN